MKILIMDMVKLPLGSAGEIRRWELIQNLSKVGHDVYVIAYKNIELKGVHTTLLKAKKGVFGKLFSRFRYAILLFKLVKTHRFDLLYTINGLIGVVGYVVKIITGSKLIYELDGIFSDEWELIKKETEISVFKRIEMALLIRIEKFALKKSDAIIAVTQGIKNHLINHGINESKITVIGNGVNIDMFRPINDPTILHRLRKQYNIDEAEHVIIFVGNLAPWQGVEYLIKAAPLILKKFPQTKFLIVGDGIMRKKLEEMVEEFKLKDKFIFTGIVHYNEVSIYINISDICISPQANDPRNERSGVSPLKLYEYMACGKPVVVGNVEGNKDVVTDSKAGFVVDPKISEDMAKAIVKLLESVKLRKLLGENGRRATVEKYSWEKVAEQTTKVYESVVNKDKN
ncbi:glycosyltransferase family 1 protein [Methanophagales archaeon]|nr:MAG: glycosyltransferase family 1 protein [Methanophagales archaeon]